MKKKLKLKEGHKQCTGCKEPKMHLYAGRYGNPRPNGVTALSRPYYVDENGLRWYDGRCHDCYLKYLKNWQKKRKDEK